MLDSADGLDWPTLCKCDLLYAVPLFQLSNKRGTITQTQKREIATRLLRSLGLAGL